MIRSVLALFMFAVALCAFIVMSPERTRPLQDNTGVGPEVTRAQPQTLLPNARIPTTPEVLPLAAAPERAPAPSVSVATDDTTISETTTNVLAGLGLVTAPADTSPETDALAAKTTNVLSQIGAATGQDLPPVSREPEPDSALERLVVAALKEGQSDAEIDALVNAAATAGQLTVPEVLVTSDGRIDTHVLLKSIVVQATIAMGGAAPAVPDVPAGDGTGVEVRVVQRATETQQYRFYTVNRGDSLGAIAVKFYGDVSYYPVIFEANRAVLSSPNLIEIGQRLTIPALPEV